jgi:hypothetical protein
VLFHEQKQLREALKRYRSVAAVRSQTLRNLYPRTIAQARQQADAIEEYLRLEGGAAGEEITLPKPGDP